MRQRSFSTRLPSWLRKTTQRTASKSSWSNGCSDDGTVEKVANFIKDRSNFQLLNNPKRLASAARNIGIKASQGDAVVIVDGHCQIGNVSFLANVAQAFIESGADVLGRPQPLDVTEATTLQRAVAAARNSRLGHHPESFIYSNQPRFVPAKSVGVAYRRDVFDQVGYFDESFDAHEDGEFNYRCDMAGLKCWFTPKIAVTYHPRDTLSGLFRQMIRYGRGRVRLLRKYPETFGLGSFLPLAFLLGLLVGIPMAFLHFSLALIYIVCIGVYLAVTTTVAVQSSVKHHSLALMPAMLLVFTTIYLGAGMGLGRELLTGRLPLDTSHRSLPETSHIEIGNEPPA